MKKTAAILAIIAASLLSGCHYVPQGSVGLRVNWDKTVEREERMPGSANNVLWGDVKDTPVRQLSVDVNDINPQASDNSTMSDFDVTIVYSINPQSAAELYIDRASSFHDVDSENHVLLMHSYMKTAVRNAAFKVARLYPGLTMNDHRKEIEQGIIKTVTETLAAEKLDTSVRIEQVMAKNMLPSAAVKASADRLVAAQSDLQAKDTELQTAKKEAERISMLTANSNTIAYMDAQSRSKLADAALAGKVNTILIPTDFRGVINTGK